MPKPVLWQCDYCHREYESRQRAESHEQDKHEEPPVLTDGGRPDGQSGSGKQHYLYCISAACPVCHTVTQFVESTESPVGLDMEVALYGKDHCSDCGVQLSAIDAEWDVQDEHEIEAVTPTQERDNDA